MKVGDVVRVVGTMGDMTLGTLIEAWDGCDGWWVVMLGNGDLINWPGSQMELVW